MDLRNELTAGVKKVAAATDKAAQELDRVKRQYDLTENGIREQSITIYAGANALAEQTKAAGLAAIEAKCAEIDAQEQAAADRRATDTGYMQRLHAKLEIAKGIDVTDLQGREVLKQNVTNLQILFQEFHDDALAVQLIKHTLGENKTFFFLPDNSCGELQTHLRKIVKPLFERAIEAARTSGEPKSRAAEIDAFCRYCAAQDESFSRSDMAIWNADYEQRKQAGQLCGLKYDMFWMSAGMRHAAR